MKLFIALLQQNTVATFWSRNAAFIVIYKIILIAYCYYLPLDETRNFYRIGSTLKCAMSFSSSSQSKIEHSRLKIGFLFFSKTFSSRAFFRARYFFGRKMAFFRVEECCNILFYAANTFCFTFIQNVSRI